METFTYAKQRKELVKSLKQHQVGNQIAPLVWKFPGQKSGPTVTVLEGVHGNETDLGLLQTILQIVKKFNVEIGNLILGIGNPGAFINGSRGTKNGHDLNREFGDQNGNSYEQKRANILKPILAQTDLLLDLHKTIKPSLPMVIVPEIKTEIDNILATLDIPLIITGQGLDQPDGEAINTDTFVAKNGGTGITIEAGCIHDVLQQEFTAKILGVLVEMSIFPEDVLPNKNKAALNPQNFNPEMYDAYWNVVGGENFSFTKKWGNFEKIQAGQVFAINNGEELYPEFPSEILFPKDTITPGKQACMIVKKM